MDDFCELWELIPEFEKYERVGKVKEFFSVDFERNNFIVWNMKRTGAILLDVSVFSSLKQNRGLSGMPSKRCTYLKSSKIFKNIIS